ncbi:MAG: asparagine--tRNA ligase [Desulfobulbaceae bacterium A2]|nr:MAG: asparagine--tRNA ligase [Desulfobulbaceae bacterium A2]
MRVDTRIRGLLATPPLGREVTVAGWVRSRRDGGGLSFIDLSDGSSVAGLQVIAETSLANYDSEVRRLTTGCAVQVRGILVPSPAKGQTVELRAAELLVLGWAGGDEYPLQKKRHSFEFLRTITHLRPRTNALAAVARVRAELQLEIHRHLAGQGFIQVHTPIITTSDCEGAGEMFTVTALSPSELALPEPFAADFFGRRAGLTVSGQLQAEVYALALGRVYTFGPTFRAENSNTSRHLAEFWMLEPEIVFCDLEGDIDCAEELLRHLVGYVLGQCAAELELFERFLAPGLCRRLEDFVARPFARMGYGEAVAILESCGQDFELPVRWGADLQSEHERYLCEQVANGPLVLTDYPAAIKPFYMRVNDDGRTVAAMDILVPGIGEIVGGSQREERLALLQTAMTAAGLDPVAYDWYLDLRRFGSAPHAGFGLGFERLLQYVSGMKNIREVIPFPRTPGFAPC